MKQVLLPNETLLLSISFLIFKCIYNNYTDQFPFGNELAYDSFATSF